MTPFRCSLLLTTILSTPLIAQERQLDAHAHGVGEMTIAIDGNMIDMEFHAPGSDIVGFEYEATSDEDLATIGAALTVLSEPSSLFTFPDAAGCVATEVEAELEEEHDEHDHDEHDDHDEEEAGHDDHDDHGDEEHHDEHEEEEADHDEHGHDDHGDEEHHDDHDDEAAESSHTEFHGHYLLTCEDTSAVTSISFGYFEAFPNAVEVEIQIVTETGAGVFEASREAPTVDLSSAF